MTGKELGVTVAVCCACTLAGMAIGAAGTHGSPFVKSGRVEYIESDSSASRVDAYSIMDYCDEIWSLSLEVGDNEAEAWAIVSGHDYAEPVDPDVATRNLEDNWQLLIKIRDAASHIQELVK